MWYQAMDTVMNGIEGVFGIFGKLTTVYSNGFGLVMSLTVILWIVLRIAPIAQHSGSDTVKKSKKEE